MKVELKFSILVAFGLILIVFGSGGLMYFSKNLPVLAIDNVWSYALGIGIILTLRNLIFIRKKRRAKAQA